MSDCTERSEGRERMQRVGTGMSDCTERSEGREHMQRVGTAMSEHNVPTRTPVRAGERVHL